MAILTRPVFYTVEPIGLDNFTLEFDEGIGELIAELNPGSYAIEELMIEVARAMNDIGTLTYTVDFDRVTRLVTISSTAAFDLLISSGSTGTDVFTLLGFTGADLTGLTTYDGDSLMGTEYLPQFPLQRFKGFEDNKRGVQASINESASGIVEVITFGTRSFMEFNIRYITNLEMLPGHPIINDPTAVQKVRAFLDFCITKGRLEFMKDETDRDTFDTILLESTRVDRQGVGYQLKEMNRLIGYFETDRLRFRKID